MVQQIKVLIVEDDQKIADFICMALRAQGYQIVTANTGNDGVLRFCTDAPDIILLDLGLPDRDGNDIIRDIRKVSAVPILVVSAREFDRDKIEALDAGANDYVTKPFSMGELLARVRVMQRYIVDRAHNEQEQKSVYHFDDLVIDKQRRRIFVGENEVHLTPLEYKLLLLLADNCGKVVTHSQIMHDVWGYAQGVDPKSIRVCMASLRRKIEKDSSHPHYILTEMGVGYRFCEPSGSALAASGSTSRERPITTT